MTGRQRKPSMGSMEDRSSNGTNSPNPPNFNNFNNGRQRKPSMGSIGDRWDRSSNGTNSPNPPNSNHSHRRNRNRSNSLPADHFSTKPPNVNIIHSTSPVNGPGNHRNVRHGRDRSNSHHWNHQHRKPQSKSNLWKGSINKDVGNAVIVQMVGMESASHTVYARVDPSCDATPESLSSVPIGKIIEIMVDEEWRHVAKSILERGVHVENDSFPSAAELLRLGAVWILNETLYAAGENAHARRLGPKDELDSPDWKDMTLRVHVHPDRFHVAHEVDWGKYCRGLLLDTVGGTGAVIGGRRAVVPVTGFPDTKDGVIMYQDKDLGFTVLNKPGGMPCHSTLSNHAEDVVSMFGAARAAPESDARANFLSLPFRVEPEMHGLVVAATRKEFNSYVTRVAGSGATAAKDGKDSKDEGEKKDDVEGKDDGDKQPDPPETDGGDKEMLKDADLTKTYRCLVCIRSLDDIDRIEKMANRTVEHYVDVRSATPKKFVRNKPKASTHEWARCLMRITHVPGVSKKLRAACVSGEGGDANASTLAHRLWGPDRDRPAEFLGVQYCTQVDVRLLTKCPHQVRGQLAALGMPIVGDGPYGGGTCEMRMHRHMWHRMAIQICHLEFRLPEWRRGGEDGGATGGGRTELVPTEERCVFRLTKAWWSEYLVDYERNLAGSTTVVVDNELNLVASTTPPGSVKGA